MVLYNTGTSNLYIVKGKDAIVYKKTENIWLYLESDDEKHTEKPILIKF